MAELEHLSTHAIDRYLADLASVDETRDLEDHVGECSACSDKLAQARHARERFLAANPPQLRAEELLETATSRPDRRAFTFGLATAATAVAAGVAFYVVYPRTGAESPPQPDILGKGAPEVTYQVLRQGQGELRPATSGEAFAAGDVIQIYVTADKPLHATIVSMSHRGDVSPVLSFPVDRPGPAPNGLAVDDSPHPERLFVLLSRSAIPHARIEEAAGAAFAAAGGLEATETFAVPGRPAAVVRSLLVRKREGGPNPRGPDVSTDETRPDKEGMQP